MPLPSGDLGAVPKNFFRLVVGRLIFFNHVNNGIHFLMHN